MPSLLDPIFESVYIPKYTPEEQRLLEGVMLGPQPAGGAEQYFGDMKKRVEEIDDVIGRLMELTGGEVVYEATEEITELTDELSERLVGDVDRIRGKISVIRQEIDADLNSKSASTFVYSFKNKPRVRKALQVVFGQKRNFITYEDYTRALEMKKERQLH